MSTEPTTASILDNVMGEYGFSMPTPAYHELIERLSPATTASTPDDFEQSNVYAFAKAQLNAAWPKREDSIYPAEMVHTCVLDLLRVFYYQGHSGMSSGVISSMFERLVKFKPLVPITEENADWVSVTEMYFGAGGETHGTSVYQSGMCSSLFKTVYPDGTVIYGDLDKVYYTDPTGASYTTGGSTSENSRVTLPYIVPDTPTCIYVNHEGKEIHKAEWDVLNAEYRAWEESHPDGELRNALDIDFRDSVAAEAQDTSVETSVSFWTEVGPSIASGN